MVSCINLNICIVQAGRFYIISSDVPDSAKHLRPSEIAWQTYHAQRTSTPIDTVLNRHISDPQTLLTLTVTEQEAREYCHSIGMKFFAKKWHDKTIIISI